LGSTLIQLIEDMAKKSDLLEQADKYVFELFTEKQRDWQLYHNYDHTKHVVDAAEEIGKGAGLEEKDLDVVMLAAWLHDTGYVELKEGHEAASIKIAKEFLIQAGCDEILQKQVYDCIEATKMPQSPQNVLEQVICDADLAGLGSADFEDRSKLLKTEIELERGAAFVNEEWFEMELEFMSNHNYHTKYAQTTYNSQKNKNLAKRHADFKKAKSKREEAEKKQAIKEKELKRKEEKAAIPEKGIETMFRVTLKNHVEFSAIADNKANIMLSINAIIISITVSGLIPRFSEHPHLIFPASLLLTVCLLTIIFATLSTKPKITEGRFTKEDIKNKTSNLLFFGNFHSMSLEEFEWGIKEMMKDKEFLYSSLIKDLYYLGRVLNKKYKYLRLCYLVFMYGMVLAVIVFSIAIATHH